MKQSYGQLIAEFDTKLSNVLLHRLLKWPVLISLFAFVGISFVVITGDFTTEGAVLRMLPIWVAALIIIICSLFFRKIYKAEIYERGFMLTNKQNQSVRSISFDQIMTVRDILWSQEVLYISIFKTREFEIHVKNEKRAISIDGKNMVNIKGFSSTFVDTFERYRACSSENVQ